MIISIPEDIYARLNTQLKEIPEKMPDVLRKVINNTAKYARKDTVRRAQERYLLQDAETKIKSASEYESARGLQFQATITIKKRPEPLMNFEVKENGDESTVQARVLKTSSLKDLIIEKDGETLKAFVQTIKNISKKGEISHHVGVFRRLSAAERRKSKSEKRNTITQLYSTSVPQMVKQEEVYKKLEADIKEELHKNLEKHIAKVMEGMT